VENDEAKKIRCERTRTHRNHEHNLGAERPHRLDVIERESNKLISVATKKAQIAASL
jgi:hypothetical protein